MPKHGTIISSNVGQGRGTAYVYDTSNLAGGTNNMNITGLPEEGLPAGTVIIMSEDNSSVYGSTGDRAIGDVNRSGAKIQINTSERGDTSGDTGFDTGKALTITSEEGMPYAGHSNIAFAVVKDGFAGYLGDS
jgi:hypothetical protein